MEVGHTIAKLRVKKGLSQKQLAADLNLSQGLIGMWETNKRVPSFEYVIALADYFQISTDVLFEKDRTLSPMDYPSHSLEISDNARIVLDTFNSLNEDNQYILIGEAKKLAKAQRTEEKRRTTITAKAT